MDTPKGWNVDTDGWLWRVSRPNDIKIGRRSDVGFDDSTYPTTRPKNKVFVKTAEFAVMFDKGKLPPDPFPANYQRIPVNPPKIKRGPKKKKVI